MRQMWGCTPRIPALRCLVQKDLEFEASWAAQGDYLIKNERSSLAIKPAHLGDGGGASCEDHMGVCLAWME